MSTTWNLHRLPAWVRRHPFLHAGWLETANRVRKWSSLPRLAGAALGACTLIVLLAVWKGPFVLDLAGEHLVIVGILMVVQSSVLTHRSRQRWTRFYSESWLATVPISRRAKTGMIALRSFFWPLATLTVMALILMVTAALTHSATGLASSVALAGAIGTAIGAPAGWWLPQRMPETALPASAQTREGSRTAPALSGISHWPVMQAKVWLQPRSIARLLILALGFPLGISANVAVAIMWVLIVGFYLSILLRATVYVAREGASWLRPTPLPFGRFAWAVVRQPILKQLQWTVITAAVLTGMGSDLVTTVRVAELWLAIFSAVSSIALTHAYHSRGMSLKMLVSVFVLAVIETLRHYMALPCALLFSGWQLRKATRT